MFLRSKLYFLCAEFFLGTSFGLQYGPYSIADFIDCSSTTYYIIVINLQKYYISLIMIKKGYTKFWLNMLYQSS